VFDKHHLYNVEPELPSSVDCLMMTLGVLI